VTDPRTVAAITTVAAPDAPAGSGDPSRRWALALAGECGRFPGITRIEAAAAAPVIHALTPGRRAEALVEVVLAVVLTEGAGPYLLDVEGRITLVLGPHPTLEGVHLAMGEPRPDHSIGLVRRVEGVVWEWVVRSRVAPARRVQALEELDAVVDLAEAAGWEHASRR
jgi:hypothetical protein